MAGQMTLDEGLKIIDNAIAKRKMIEDGHLAAPFTTEENMEAYDAIYTLCTQKPPYDYSQQLYEKHREYLNDKIMEKIVPTLADKHGVALLTEVMQTWLEYNAFSKYLSKLFVYLDRYYIPRRSLDPLGDISKQCFCNLVFDKLYSKLQEATLSMIIQEREGKQIDQKLLKTVVEFILDVGGQKSPNYYEKLEQAMVAEAAAYYSHLSSECWFWRDSFSNYLRKVDWCLVQEEGRAEIYPCQTTKTKLLESIKYILLDRNAKQWAQNAKTEELAAEDQVLLSKYKCLSLG